MYQNIEIYNPEEQKIDFKIFQSKHLIDLNKPIKRQPIAISIGDYWHAGHSHPIPFGSYGDFSCLVGPSKSMKTFLKTALIASYIGGSSDYYFPDFKGHLTEGKYILDIDTEQSTFHVQRSGKRIIEMVGEENNLYRLFALRELSPKIRLQFIEWLIMESEYKQNLGLVTIDGAADLLEDVNDLKESNSLVHDLMKWTSISNCHICTVLHRNFGSNKPTGHLGSAILKKAETVAFVEREGDVTKVTPEYTRNYPFKEFQFCLDNNHLPIVIDEKII